MKIEEQEALAKGINLFNRQRYFEAHEEWEEEWRLMPEGDDRTFFQGLILAAGAFYHYARRESAGAAELLEKSIAQLKKGIEGHPEMGVAPFIVSLERLRTLFSDCSFRLAPEKLPVIRMPGLP